MLLYLFDVADPKNCKSLCVVGFWGKTKKALRETEGFFVDPLGLTSIPLRYTRYKLLALRAQKKASSFDEAFC